MSVLCLVHINRHSVTIESHSFSSSFAVLPFFLRDPHPPALNLANLLMKECVMVVVVEAVKLFIIQTVKGFGGPH